MIFLVIAGVAILAGCSDDEEGPTEPVEPTIQTVTVVGGSTAPDPYDPFDGVWNTITASTVNIAADRFSASGKIRPGAALAVASNVSVKATVVNDTLYMRVNWSDDSQDIWPARFAVTDLDILAADTFAVFTKDEYTYNEDQLMFFVRPPDSLVWDVINWRAVTTGGGNLAEEFNYDEENIVRDAGNNSLISANDGEGGYPAYMPENAPTEVSVLSVWDAVTAQFDTDSVSWEIGDRIAGWLIDDSLHLPSHLAQRGSRYATLASHSYSVASESYTIVLCRPLDTGFDDDIDLELSLLEAKIGITNNSEFHLSQGDSRQGYTATFNLQFPKKE